MKALINPKGSLTILKGQIKSIKKRYFKINKIHNSCLTTLSYLIASSFVGRAVEEEGEIDTGLRFLEQQVGQEHGLVPLKAQEGEAGIKLRETKASQQRVRT